MFVSSVLSRLYSTNLHFKYQTWTFGSWAFPVVHTFLHGNLPSIYRISISTLMFLICLAYIFFFFMNGNYPSVVHYCHLPVIFTNFWSLKFRYGFYSYSYSYVTLCQANKGVELISGLGNVNRINEWRKNYFDPLCGILSSQFVLGIFEIIW